MEKASIDLDKIDLDSGALVQSMFDALKSKKPGMVEARAHVQDLGKYARDLRQPLVVLYNTFASVCSEVQSQDLTRSEARDLLNKGVSTYMKEVALFTSRFNRGSSAYEQKQSQTADFMRNSLRTRQQLQTELLKKGIFVGYAPIIPIFASGFFDTDKLSRTGIKFRMFEGYPVLEKQLIVGMTLDRQGRIVDPTKSTPNLSKREIKNKQQEVEANFERFVEAVKSKFGNQRLIQVDKTITRYGATWAWLAPDKEMSLMLKAKGGTFNLRSWDFAFPG